MAFVKLIATRDFSDQEGEITDGQKFSVNEERARVLIISGRAERDPDQSDSPALQNPNVPSSVTFAPLGVPRKDDDIS